MSNTQPIPNSLVENADIPATAKLLKNLTIPVVMPPKGQRCRLEFALDPVNTSDRSIVAHYTFDDTPPSATVGKQIVRGTVINLQPEQVLKFKIIKEGVVGAVKFSADFFAVEQKRG